MSNKSKGRSGNRQGIKVFSINTTIRNPKRNTEFLKVFLPYSGKIFLHNESNSYLCDLVKYGIVKFTNVSNKIIDKWANDVPLNQAEINELINNNPQATGEHGRVMTQLRSLKDQGFLIFDDKKISVSQLGMDLVNDGIDSTLVYTKSMIGMHAFNPSRPAMHNKSRPFLNTLFVINEVNSIWGKLGNEPKGILTHEFYTFVLSMTDCDYKKTAKEIIEYRKKFRYEKNQEYINEYLINKGMLPVSNSTLNAYYDDVFRKFEMTGLLIKHGAFNYIYINFSNYNMAKVESILEKYKDYKFMEFENQNDYYSFLYKVEIPWEQNLTIRRKIAKAKALYLGRKLNDDISLEEEELQLDRAFYSSALSKAIEKYDLKFLLSELMILTGKYDKDTKFEDIGEPLRLEYLLALIIGKLYGTDGLVSNIIYNENGEPLHYAPGKRADMILFREEGSLILEPTMLSTRDQQLRNETTSINLHFEEENRKRENDYRVVMVAPKVHQATIDYFTYRSTRKNLKMLTLTIAKMVGLFGENNLYANFLNALDSLCEFFKENQDNLLKCEEAINSYLPPLNYYQ